MEADVGLFSVDYQEARERFLSAVRHTPLPFRQRGYTHPLFAPDGKPLVLDAIWLGPENAGRVLVISSACHGVEGFAGSAIQLDSITWLETLPTDIALLYLHALNPWGYAWLCRTDEQGIDINRNFVDFEQGVPENPGYEQLAEALVPPRSDAESACYAKARLDAYRDAHGQRALEEASSSGQYTHPQGLFYGGTRPCWTRRQLEKIYSDFGLSNPERLAVIDIHTGLGRYGNGEVICDHEPGSIGLQLAKRWYGSAVTEPLEGSSSSVPKYGLMDYFWHQRLGSRGCFVTLEFGTYPVEDMFRVLGEDVRLQTNNTLADMAEHKSEIKQQLLHHFYPDDRRWRISVLNQGRLVVQHALAGLQHE